MTTAKLKWAGNMKFDGRSKFGLPISTDAARKSGGTEEGYAPMELVMFGLAGCTGVDVVRIMQKKRQNLTGLEIEVSGFQPDEYPKPFNRIEIKYVFYGNGLEAGKIEQAISLSEEKYCSVSQSLAGTAKIVSSYKIVEE